MSTVRARGSPTSSIRTVIADVNVIAERDARLVVAGW
jgi:hypothetical protein